MSGFGESIGRVGMDSGMHGEAELNNAVLSTVQSASISVSWTMILHCTRPHSRTLHEVGDHAQDVRSSTFSVLKMLQGVLHMYFENIQKTSQLAAEFVAKVSFQSGRAFLKPHLPGTDHVTSGASQPLSDGSKMTLPLFLTFPLFFFILPFPEKLKSCLVSSRK